MNKKLNILESVRGGAALYVFLGHFIIQSVIDKTNHYLFFFKFGQEAVILFFLMSGFVIQLSYRKKPISFFKYFKKRFFRIYPLFLVSIILVVGYKFIEGLPIEIKTLVGNLFMLQDMSSLKPGTIVATYGNSALWSLSYEWWFYILFIPVSSFKNKNTVAIIIVGISALLYFMYPIQIFRWLMYFGIWWSGVMLANFYLDKELNFKNIFTKIIVPVLIFPSLFLIFKALTTTFDSIGVYPVLEIRHFACAILFILIAFIWKKTHWLGYDFFKPLEQIAPFSYGLYVLHLPLIMIFEPIVSKYIDNGFIKFIIVCFLVVLISFLFETKLQKKINSVLFKKNSFFSKKTNGHEEKLYKPIKT
jgi:peptidoglycan/LPS O-acetylase OafA/YrhL